MVLRHRSCRKGLRAANPEADVLVARCQSMDWNSPRDRREFGRRASTYLGVHEVRSKLSSALGGLRASIPPLKKKTDGIKRNKAQRKTVLFEIETKLEAYERYLDELESQENRSGVISGAIYAAWQRARKVRTTRDANERWLWPSWRLRTANALGTRRWQASFGPSLCAQKMPSADRTSRD